jgi:glucokinase
VVDTPTIIGIDVGGTKTAVVEGTTGGEILQRSMMPTNGARPFIGTFPALAELVERTISTSQSTGRRPIAISVAVAGPLDAAIGRLLDPPNLPGWHDVSLTRTLERRFPALPVFIEHDAKAGALAEFRFGAGASRQGLRDMVFLTFGTGNGAGIIVGGQLMRGANEMAGEVWAMPVAPDESTRLKTTEDGWESVSSGRGLLSIARRLYPSRWNLASRISDVVDAALAGDKDALEVINEAALWLGSGLAVLVSILNPQLIVIGSLAGVLGDRLLAPARTVMARHTLPRAMAACELVPGLLGSKLGDVQSLMAALEALGPL